MEKSDFEYALKLNSYIKITIDDEGDEDEYYGTVVALSDTFVAIIEIDLFHTDGLTVIPINRIEKYRCGIGERNRKQILKFIGLKIEDSYAWLELSSFMNLFKAIHKAEQATYVECNETAEVGYVQSSEKDNLLMRTCGSEGAWSEEPAVIAHKNIYAVCIGDEYSSVLCKYADRRKH